jgi:RimJ/RimL family protein N-acetyltransferase
MIKLSKKLGFKQEACFRKVRVVGGKHFDGLGFGILREEWEFHSLFI